MRVDFDAKRVDAVFADLNQCHFPGAAVGIAIGGKPVYRKGFGLANMELPLALTPSLRMRIGSTSKHFTSLAIMLLCEQGRAAVDDPLGQHLPELHPVIHRITLRQLMGHTGGLRDAVEVGRQFSGTSVPVSGTDLLALYRTITDLDAAPGTAWNYNNGGYLILGAIVERITGQSLEEVLRERIFVPSGLYDTVLRRFDTDFLPNSAALHTSSASGGFEKSYFNAASAGFSGISSTVDDLLRWLVHMDHPTVGTTATWNLLKTPQVLANGTSTGYGFGLITDHYRGAQTLSHAGSVMGGNSQVLKVPGAALDVVVLVNRHDVSAMALTNQVLDACLPDLLPVSEVAAHETLATGIFRSPTSGRVIELWASGRQQMVTIDGFDWEFTPGSERVLQPTPVWSYLKKTVTLLGPMDELTAIRFSDYGNVDELTRLDRVKKSDPTQIAGRYRSDDTGTEAIITETDVGAQLLTVGRFGSVTYQLSNLAEGIWRAKSSGAVQWWGGILTFEPDSQTFRFSSGRVTGLLFRREAASAVDRHVDRRPRVAKAHG